jgi:hypothetical protein
MSIDYSNWENWCNLYDSDGDELDLNLKIPLDDVSTQFLEKSDLKNISAECGKPMTQVEFDNYMKTRDNNPTILKV